MISEFEIARVNCSNVNNVSMLTMTDKHKIYILTKFAVTSIFRLVSSITPYYLHFLQVHKCETMDCTIRIKHVASELCN